jgi:hypothetical protein
MGFGLGETSGELDPEAKAAALRHALERWDRAQGSKLEALTTPRF